MLNRVEVCALVGSTMLLGLAIANSKTLVRIREAPSRSEPNRISRRTLERIELPLVRSSSQDKVFQLIDYECPPCHGIENECSGLRSKLTGVSWSIVQFPLPFHLKAEELGVASTLALKAGMFLRFHKAMMTNWPRQNETAPEYVDRLMPDFRFEKFELESGKAIMAHQRDTLAKLGVNSTPTFICFRKDGHSLMVHRPSQVQDFFEKKADTKIWNPEPCKLVEGCD